MKTKIYVITIMMLCAVSSIIAQANSIETISIAAESRGNSYINFTNGKPLANDAGNLSANGAFAPLALASADFDADGMRNLAIAYQTADGGNSLGNLSITSDASGNAVFSRTFPFGISFPQLRQPPLQTSATKITLPHSRPELSF